MSNLKGKVSLLLALVMMMMTIMPIANADVEEVVIRMMTLTAKYNGKVITDGSTITANVGDKITVTTSNYKPSRSGAASSPNLSTLQIGRFWDTDSIAPITTGKETATITVPNFEAGSSHVLVLEAILNDDAGGYVGQSNIVTIYVSIPEDKVATKVTTELKDGSKVLPTAFNAEPGQKLTLSGKTNNGERIIKVYYKLDGMPIEEVNASSTVITLPSDLKPGTHELQVSAEANDGTLAEATTYVITIPATATATPTATPTPTAKPDGELVVEPWMKENKELDGLSVSLRNEPENEKANKNFYALNEKVTYFVDYKNGSDKAKKNVKLVLELPLDVKVLDANGGKVEGRKITWEFPEGLEKGEEGTKVVDVKYISLGKASVKSKIVYPVADIYEGNKVVDSSAVINLIYKDTKTEIIDDEHYPYMYGDAEADTFRPDDGITRAEGALVLTRIFGMNTSGVQITNLYPDLGETYEEAQKAIVAATKAGLINGYPDGTYRPNEKMTRGEFMKIIAGNIELAAKNNDLADNVIDGLRVKSLDEEIKVYKNPVKVYVANGQNVSEHWASPYVTLLARLNMTDLTAKNKDLRLDETITRAEVAQLVNFYLFRAPAEVDSKTKSGFSDVNRKHNLFADIIEATRAAHTYTLTLDGTELAVED